MPEITPSGVLVRESTQIERAAYDLKSSVNFLARTTIGIPNRLDTVKALREIAEVRARLDTLEGLIDIIEGAKRAERDKIAAEKAALAAAEHAQKKRDERNAARRAARAKPDIAANDAIAA